MNKILISQRLDFLNDINENREGLDINLINFIWEIGLVPITISASCFKYGKLNDYLNEINPDGILLSGGNDIGQTKLRDNLEFDLLNWALKNFKPVFGICRGLQIINKFQGGNISKIKNHLRVRHKLKGINIFNNKDVNSFHNYHVNSDTIGEELIPLAWTNDQCIEALRHHKHPWLAIMWHPEREIPFKEFDLNLILNHFIN